MLVVGLTLEVGRLTDGKFVFGDAYDFVISGKDGWNVDNVNNLLNGLEVDDYTYAQLKFWYAGAEENSFLVGSFRRMKLKGKGTKWVLTE